MLTLTNIDAMNARFSMAKNARDIGVSGLSVCLSNVMVQVNLNLTSSRCMTLGTRLGRGSESRELTWIPVGTFWGIQVEV